ncbi:hypothetical protein ACFXKC_11315 [Streptomyces sp. NPDC059340]|uniref:hypothetical protein n=1 Tax=Streptomyces sp. NPDC059340 TaxID=3346806 RepID=UPI0036827BCC
MGWTQPSSIPVSNSPPNSATRTNCATEQDNMDELRRLADQGNTTAAEQLAEPTAE